jgi:hypothetical protein
MQPISANKKKHATLLYPELSYDVVGLCYEAHNEIGIFAKEKQYGNLFEQKLMENHIQDLLRKDFYDPSASN